MPNRGSNLDILKSLYDVSPETTESFDEFCKRIVITINDDEEHWEDLPEAIQMWYSDINADLEQSEGTIDDLEFPDFPGMSRVSYEEPAPEAPKESKPEKKESTKKEKKPVKQKVETKKKEPKPKKEKKPSAPKKITNAQLIRNKIFTEYGVTFNEVLAYLKEEGAEAKESSVKLLYTSANKDVEIILQVGGITDKEGNQLLVKA